MEGDAAAAVLQTLVQNLIDVLKKEISQIRGVNKEAVKLADSLLTIQNFLNDAEMRTIPDEMSIKNWLRKLEDAAFDADHVLDEVNYHRLSKEIMKPEKKNKVLFSCFAFCTHISRSRETALKIIEINENIDSINKEATDLGLVQRLANAPAVPDVCFETDSITLDPIFIGRDGVVSEIVDKILTTTQGERAISILTIVGMGGLGKTTLTRKVFNYETIEAQFGSRIWVHVSRDFDPDVLLKKILMQCMSSAQAESRQEIMTNLAKALKDKVYFLVLDDVWNENSQNWGDFLNALSGVNSTKGNAIVVTTRSTAVASIVNPLSMHQLKGLSEEDCWSIIKEKALGKGVDAPSEIESIGRKIAERCQGSPLAANVVGGVLRRDKSEEKWLSIEQKWLTRDDGENITRILRLSFDSLSSASLKKCFAYCSMFPKGYKIDKQEVIEQWMAEGFLHPDDGSDDMEFVGEKFINILLNNSLLQVADGDYISNVDFISMHDLVHDLACSVLGCSDKADSSNRVRYMVVLNDELSSIDRSKMRYFRTLLVELRYDKSIIDFSSFECLHVLTLQQYGVKELPISIKKLIHLRKLNISGTSIEWLPEWIGEFHYLQTLRAETGYLKELPSTMKYLINIRHLYLDMDVVLPAGIGILTSLQTLRYFAVGDENGCNIAELESLNNLKGRLHIHKLERVRDKEEAAKANLFGKSKISELKLGWGHHECGEGEIKNDENVLEGLQPHAHLEKLVIDGFKGKRFPAWVMKMAIQNVPGGSWIGLNKLTGIVLSKCYECEEIPMLGHLPNLKSLSLEGLRKVKRINSSVYGLAYKDTRVVFPALETLELKDMPELAEWAEVESDVQVFPRLRRLTIVDCKYLMSVPTHSLSCLEELVIRRVGSSMVVANIFRNRFALLSRLWLEGIDDLEYLPNWLFNENPNLSSLDIRNWPKLRELPPGLRTLRSSLKELIIGNCPCLERMEQIPDDGGEQSQSQGISFFFTSLRYIKIERCDALVWLPRELMGSSLEELSLTSLKSLSSVVGVPKFMATTSHVEVLPLRSLRELDIDARIVEVGGSMDGLLQGCSHSLKYLTIRGGMEDWDCLPQSMEGLTVIDVLELDNFGMEELPEWFGNLSSLGQLHVRNCKKLRRLPFMDATWRPQRLFSLTIDGCPELRDDDLEWRKFSHLFIKIDGNFRLQP